MSEVLSGCAVRAAIQKDQARDILDRLADVVIGWGDKLVPREKMVEVPAGLVTGCWNEIKRLRADAERLRAVSDQLITAWRKEFYEKFDMGDFDQEDFGSIALGFFIAKGCTPDQARQLYERCIEQGVH